MEIKTVQIDRIGSWRRATGRTLSILVSLLSVGGTAWAQVLEQEQAPENQRPRRVMQAGYVNVDAVLLSGGPSFREFVNPTEKYGEATNFETLHATPSGALPSISLGLRVWRNLAVGVGATYFSGRHDVELRGTVPHPLFYGRGRDVVRPLDGYRHSQTGIHAHAAWTVPIAERLDVTLSAGPSLFLVRQDRVSEAVVTVSGPTYGEFQVEPAMATVAERAFGANAGIDATYHLYRQLGPGALFWAAGLGFFVRWTEAAVGFASEVDPAQRVSLDVGGLQYGAGLRFRF